MSGSVAAGLPNRESPCPRKDRFQVEVAGQMETFGQFEREEAGPREHGAELRASAAPTRP